MSGPAPTPRTAAFFASEPSVAECRAFAERLERQHDEARAERDIAFSLGEHAMFCVHHTDAERVANTIGGNCPICNKAQIRQLRDERDELNRQLSVALKGKRPYSSKFADETIAAQVKRIAELEEKLNGWFSERDAFLDALDEAAKGNA